MTLIEQIRRRTNDAAARVDLTPVYAVVGLADKALETVRVTGEEIEARVEQARQQATPTALRRNALGLVGDVQARAIKTVGDAQARAVKTAGDVRALPNVALSRGMGVVGRVSSDYTAYASRGEKLVTAIREQQATHDLVIQAESTVARAKGAVTTARHALENSEKQVGTLVDTAAQNVAHNVATVRSATRASATSARKTIAAAGRATTAAAEKSSATETPTPAAKRSTPARSTSTTTRKAAAKKSAATRKATTTRKTAARKATATKANATKAAKSASVAKPEPTTTEADKA